MFFGVLLMLLLSGKYTEAEVMTPLYRVEGDSMVLVLMDIHTFTTENNNSSINNNNNNNDNNDNNDDNYNDMCWGFSPRAAELAFTLEWIHQDMVSKGQTPVPGLFETDIDLTSTLMYEYMKHAAEGKTKSFY